VILRSTPVADAPVGVKVVRRVSARARRRMAARPRVPSRHVTVCVPAAVTGRVARHQVVSLAVPVVARWVTRPAPEVRTTEVMVTARAVVRARAETRDTEWAGAGVGATAVRNVAVALLAASPAELVPTARTS
jgi:hypothetical protein